MSLVPIRTDQAYQVQTQNNTGWVALCSTDHLDVALEMMEMVVLYNDCAVRIIEPANGNIVDEQFPEYELSQEAVPLDFDWKESGF